MTNLTARDILALEVLSRYFLLSRHQLQRLVFSEDRSGRVARRRMLALVQARLVQRMPITVTALQQQNCGSVYFPTRRGLEYLAEHLGDGRYLAGSCQTPQAHHLAHWLAVSETHITLDAALAGAPEVTCPRFINEWDIVNAAETEPSQRFRLYSLLRENPRLVCAPDAAFLLECDGERKVYYLEIDRNTSGAQQVAASKSGGYAAMLPVKHQRRHFPEETVGQFSVLLIAPTPGRRDSLRKAMKDKPGAAAWLFACANELTAASFLVAPVFFKVDGTPVSLLAPLATSDCDSASEVAHA